MKQRFRGLWTGVFLLATALVGCPQPHPDIPPVPDLRVITGKVMVPKIISNGTAKIISNGGAKIISNGGAKYRIAADGSEMASAPAQNYAVILQDNSGNYLGDGVATTTDGSYALEVRLGTVIPNGQTKAVAQVVAYNDAKAVVSAQVVLDRNSTAGTPISVNLDKISTLMAMTGKAAIAAGKDPEQAVSNFAAATTTDLLEKAGQALMSVAVVSLDKMNELVNLDPETLADNAEQANDQITDEINTKLDEALANATTEQSSIISSIIQTGKDAMVTVEEKAQSSVEQAPENTVIATPVTPTPAPNIVPTPTPTPRPIITPTPSPTPIPLSITSVSILTPATDTINVRPVSGDLDPAFGVASVQLTANVVSNKANSGVTWSIANGTLATVDANGLVTSVRDSDSNPIVAGGNVDVKATSKDNASKFAIFTIHVTANGGANVGIE